MPLKTFSHIAFFLVLLFASPVLTAQQTNVASSPRLLLPVKQGGLWGYADTSRNMVISPQFNAANPFEGRIAIVELKDKAYAIDSTGKILTPGFDQVFILEDTILAVYLNMISDSLGGWGLSTISGKPILPPAYDEVLVIDSNLFTFRKDTLWGAVNREGVTILPPEYDTIALTPNRGLLIKKGKFWGACSREGFMYLETKYKFILFPDRNLLLALLGNKKTGGWGGVNLSPEIIIPFQFDSLIYLNSYFVVAKEKDSLSCYFTRAKGNPQPGPFKTIRAAEVFWTVLYDFNGNCGVADTMGKLVAPVIYADVAWGGRGNWLVMDTARKWGFHSPKGELKIAPSFTRIIPFRENVTIVFQDEKQGLINEFGEILEPPSKQKVIIRGRTVKLLHADNSATFLTLDANGRVIDRSNFDEFRVIKMVGAEARVATGTQMGLRGAWGGPSVFRYVPVVDSIDWFFDKKTGLFGLRNTFTGRIIIPPTYNEVSAAGSFYSLIFIRDTIECMSIDGQATYGTVRVGLINDTSGQIVLQPVYTTIMAADLLPGGFYGCVRATLPNGQIALVTTDGTERRMPYTWVEKVQNGYARVCIKGKWTVTEPGERINTLEMFASEQSLHPFLSFGKAALVKTFMEKSLCIAGGKWGYVDSAGTLVVETIYDGAKASEKNTGIVKQEKKWGMIDMKNTSIIPCVYDGLSYLHSDTGTFVTAQSNGIRYGYIDRNGTIAIPADLKLSKSLGPGFIGFSRTGKWGVMKNDGTIICNETYQEILPFSDGYAAVRKGARWGYIDTSGTEVIEPQFQKAGNFKDGMARIVSKSRWGYVSTDGSIAIEPVYLQAGDFCAGAAPVRTRDGFGLISKEGKWLIKPQYRSITLLDSSGIALFVIRDDAAGGLCRNDGKILISPRYERFRYLGEGRIAYLSNLSWGMLDTSGKVITGAVFGQIKPFSQKLAAAQKNNLWGYIRPNGSFAIPPQYELAAGFIENRAYTIASRRAQFIDTNGRVLLRIKKDYALMGYSEGKYLIAKLDKKQEVKSMFFMTRHGVLVNRFEYKEALVFQEGAARVRPGGVQWGLISYTGHYLIKPRFYKLGPFENGLARFQMLYTVGLFSIDGKPLLPVTYDSIVFDGELGMIRCDRGNAVGWLFPDGRICWPESE